MKYRYASYGMLGITFLALIMVQCQANPDAVCNDPNEEYASCGSRCPDTCESVFQQGNKGASRMCTMECVQGCFCKAGFVRNTVTNQCVDPRFCKMPRDQQDVARAQGANGATLTLRPSLLVLFFITSLLVNFIFH